MTLVYDLRTMQVFFTLPPDGERLKRRKVSVAEAIRIIIKAQQSRVPAYKLFYERHHDAEIVRRRVWRANNREWVAEYNRNYYLNRKTHRELTAGHVRAPEEGIPCSM